MRDRAETTGEARPPPTSPVHVTLDHLREMLPDLDELRPLLDHAVRSSQPDEGRAWSGSGRLGTLGSRLVDPTDLTERLARVAEAEAAHLRTVYGAVARAVEALSTSDASRAAQALLLAAQEEEQRDRPDRAEAYASAAASLVRPTKDRSTEALATRRAARAIRTQGRLDEAVAMYERAFDLSSALSERRAAAEAAIGAGNAREDQGRWAEATSWYERALGAVHDVEGPVAERLHALFNLHVATRWLDPEESVTYLLQAEDEASRLGDDSAAPFFGNAWGQLRMAEGDFAAAVEHFQRALDHADGTRARVTIGVNLAEALLAQRRTLDAAEAARRAEREAITVGFLPMLPEIYRLLGRVVAANGEPDAFVLFERALQIVQDHGLSKLEEALTLQSYAELERETGDAAAAEALQERAAECFRALGISARRKQWADVMTTTDDERGLESQR